MVEECGYYWFWVVEYYNNDEIVGFVFEVFLGYFVVSIRKICLVLGGVML